ncbi:dihydropteridine reductase-like protein [Basidiobolus meristosporus CBS 931.73]|uniref:Dihydropteridine reductase n=1 Tax=Basidiobolus meristosporus CBS 931.73 TaxID=1314790 RepID=A0A1Y1Z104_9FUNG|nr:dihydropteridine reductase-like protein [Basidiobolus meristosporus CBS 931.73]|eukprot:ORY03627.1 dihydropteridine reductase-like protein [Basidiobolus meristosporus CBS 931.73]
MSAASNVIIYGGSGALGSSVVKFFKKMNWSVISIDLVPSESADKNVTLSPSDSFEEQGFKALSEVEKQLAGNKADAVLCVAGGWAGGNASSKDLFANSELMWKQSVQTSLIAAHIASQHLKEGGFVSLTGAYPAQKGTPGMIGYGLAKAAVHQLVQSLAEKASGLPKDSKVNAILPITLDTPMNRKFMGDGADLSSWTPLDAVAEKLFEWATKPETVESGKLVEIITSEGKTVFH